MDNNMTFEQAYGRLKADIAKLQDSHTPLDESIKIYAETGDLLLYCLDLLDEKRGEIVEINTRINRLMREREEKIRQRQMQKG